MSTEATPAPSAPTSTNNPTPAAAPETKGAPSTPPNPAPAPSDAPAAKLNDQPSLEDAMKQVNLDNLNEGQIADLESGDPERIAKALGVEAPKKDALSENNGNEPSPANNGDEAPERISIKALPASERAKLVKALTAVRSGKAAPDAFAEAFGTFGTPQAPATLAAKPEGDKPTDQPPAPEVKSAPKVAELETRLAELKADYDKKKAEYDPTAQDILEQMQDLKLDLRDAKREAEQDAREELAWMNAQKASHERAMSQFADLITESPDFLDYCEAEIVLAERKNDPVMAKPDWPENIAKRVSEKYFNGKAANSSAPAKDEPHNPIPPAPNQRVRIPGSPVGPAFAPGSLTVETAQAEFDKLTTEQQEATLAEIVKRTSKPS
jgi:hypothetical protein